MHFINTIQTYENKLFQTTIAISQTILYDDIILEHLYHEDVHNRKLCLVYTFKP